MYTDEARLGDFSSWDLRFDWGVGFGVEGKGGFDREPSYDILGVLLAFFATSGTEGPSDW